MSSGMKERPDHNFLYEWHVAINQVNRSSNWRNWMYEAKTAADEIPRLAMIFKMERENMLPKVMQACSHSEPVPVPENYLTCCLGVKCRECPALLGLDKAKLTPDEIDLAKAWTCAAHIISETGKRLVDTSEGYILTVDDRMYWDRVYEHLAQPSEEAQE